MYQLHRIANKKDFGTYNAGSSGLRYHQRLHPNRARHTAKDAYPVDSAFAADNGEDERPEIGGCNGSE
ncbi:MAG TPA: hypothetical protein VMZ30_00985 [Pyrinomonadaceae bacterium]|nr:hypothetical protein [Pyrinomonadaceae bacterium]